jgi:hypothetical protein
MARWQNQKYPVETEGGAWYGIRFGFNEGLIRGFKVTRSCCTESP